MKVKSQSEVVQSCLTLRDPMDCTLPGSSVHGIFQARVLEWGVNKYIGLQFVAQLVKNPPTNAGDLGWEDPLEEAMATHSSILAWRIPMDRGAWQAAAHRVAQSLTQLKQLSMHA